MEIINEKNLVQKFALANAAQRIPSILVGNEPKLIFDSKNKIFLGKEHKSFDQQKIDGLREGLKEYLKEFILLLNKKYLKSLKNRINDSDIIDYINEFIELTEYMKKNKIKRG